MDDGTGTSRAALLTTPDWVATGTQDYANFGFAVASAGDVNGDGFDDALVGQQLFTGPAGQAGRASLYLGSSAGLGTTPAWEVLGAQANEALGHALDGAGDVNGDVFGDVIVGRNALSGRLVVWYLDRAGNRSAGTFTTPAEPSPDPAAWSVSGPR